jgi:hypothetical protein
MMRRPFSDAAAVLCREKVCVSVSLEGCDWQIRATML